ncbi:sugar phosphate nucleotidyltransferase [Thermodesulfobacteriota bacterium]
MQNRTVGPTLKNEQVRTALLLAAGTGSRLAPLTDQMPKCLVPVNEISILERLVDSLQEHRFKKLVIVVGHQADAIRNFLGSRAGGMDITYITSPAYKTTNNIYSLWLARKVINEPFLLLESDIVFDSAMLKGMLQPDRIAVAKLQPGMDGTTVTIDKLEKVGAFYDGAHKQRDNKHYKTVNFYSLSRQTWDMMRERLDQLIAAQQVNGYYETVFADMVSEGCLSFAPVLFDHKRWHEIDNLVDLRAAERMCALRRQPAVRGAAKISNKLRCLTPPAYAHLKTLGSFRRVATTTLPAALLHS